MPGLLGYAAPPKYKREDFLPPPDYDNKSRGEKARWQEWALGGAMADYGNEAYAGRDEEERRGAAAESLMREAGQKADKPTITSEEIARRFSRESDKASDSFLSGMDTLREYSGASGVTGGGEIGGIAANMQLARLAQLTTARSDLMSFKATSDALDRQRVYDRSGTLAQYVNRPISMLGIDFQNQNAQNRQALLGVEANRATQKYAAEASKPGILDYVRGLSPIVGAAVG